MTAEAAQECRLLRDMTEEELRARGWEMWRRPHRKRSRPALAVTLLASNVFMLSQAAFRAIGSPTDVVFLVDKKGRQVAIQPGESTDPAARRVSQKSRIISLRPLVRKFELQPGRRTCTVQDGHLVFNMDL